MLQHNASVGVMLKHNLRCLDRFAGSEPLAIHAGNSRVRAFPTSARLEIIERLKSIADRYGLEVVVCACKNPDISRGSCHISGRWPPVPRGGSQLALSQVYSAKKAAEVRSYGVGTSTGIG